MNKKFIVENLEFDPKFKTEKEIEDLKFKRDQAIGVWDIEGKTDDDLVAKLFDEVQNYMGVYLTSLSYCNNRPHPCLLYTSPSPRDGLLSRMPSSA